MLDEAGARELPVARGVPCVVRIAPGEAVIAAEPEVLRARVVDDPVDRAELLAPIHFGRHDVGTAENVVVNDVQLAGRVDGDAVRVAALVNWWIAEERARLVIGVPITLATVLALVADEDHAGGATLDGDHGRRPQARAWIRGCAIRHAEELRLLSADVPV